MVFRETIRSGRLRIAHPGAQDHHRHVQSERSGERDHGDVSQVNSVTTSYLITFISKLGRHFFKAPLLTCIQTYKRIVCSEHRNFSGCSPKCARDSVDHPALVSVPEVLHHLYILKCGVQFRAQISLIPYCALCSHQGHFYQASCASFVKCFRFVLFLIGCFSLCQDIVHYIT